jgi:hypothetical protein
VCCSLLTCSENYSRKTFLRLIARSFCALEENPLKHDHENLMRSIMRPRHVCVCLLTLLDDSTAQKKENLLFLFTCSNTKKYERPYTVAISLQHFAAPCVFLQAPFFTEKSLSVNLSPLFLCAGNPNKHSYAC